MFSGLTPGEIIALIVSLILSMSAHEAMHGFVAHWLGDTTAEEAGRLTLNPLKHIDIYTTVIMPVIMVLIGLPPLIVARPVPFNPERVKFREYGVALVGIAGPVTNLILAIVVAFLLRLLANDINTTIFSYLEIFMEINVLFFVFNMIPIPPLDGSRLLYAFAPEPVRRIMDRFEALGFASIIVIFLLVFAFMSPLIFKLDNNILNLLVG